MQLRRRFCRRNRDEDDQRLVKQRLRVGSRRPSAISTIDDSMASSISTDCKEVLPSGLTGATVTFSTPSDTTLFDRSISLSVVEDGVTSETMPIYIRYNADEIAIARNEDNANGSSRAN